VKRTSTWEDGGVENGCDGHGQVAGPRDFATS
jgi:hypothetical protein